MAWALLKAFRRLLLEKVMAPSKNSGKIRYAVVGLGHIAQVAVLPAFAHARSNSQLTALVSTKAKKSGPTLWSRPPLFLRGV
jgi:hypothetical protein